MAKKISNKDISSIEEVEKVFMKGDALTPSRFWSYALSSKESHENKYIELGFTYSKRDTDAYRELTRKLKDSIMFSMVDGVSLH